MLPLWWHSFLRQQHIRNLQSGTSLLADCEIMHLQKFHLWNQVHLHQLCAANYNLYVIYTQLIQLMKLFLRILFIIHGWKEILNSNMVKGEVVLVHAMYGYRKSRGTVPLILNLGRSTSCPTSIYPEKPLALNWTQAGWAPPMFWIFRTKKKIYGLCHNKTLHHPAHSLSFQWDNYLYVITHRDMVT